MYIYVYIYIYIYIYIVNPQVLQSPSDKRKKCSLLTFVHIYIYG